MIFKPLFFSFIKEIIKPKEIGTVVIMLYDRQNKTQKNIAWFFIHDKVFYQDNSVGDAINNYLKTCMQL